MIDTIATLTSSPPSPLEDSFWFSPPSPLSSEFYSHFSSIELKERFVTISSAYASKAARMGIFRDAARRTRKSDGPLVAFPSTEGESTNIQDDVPNDTSTSSAGAPRSPPRSKTISLKPKGKRSFAKLLDLAKQGSTKQTEDPPLSPPPLSFASGGTDFSEFALVTPPLECTEANVEVVEDGEGIEQPVVAPVQSPDASIRWRGAIPHHSFPTCDAPYMVSYSASTLQSDYHSYELCHQLCPKGSPTFHEYGDQPPSNVLDLGCGEGYWAAEAATAWKPSETKVTALDLVDLGSSVRRSLPPEVASNMSWVQGNFVKDALPFKDDSFDLVRIANLTMAIPYEQWSNLLVDIKRVLKPGGRLELLDDQLFFPEVQYPYETVDDIGIPKLSTSTFNGDTMGKVDGIRRAGLFRSKSLKARPTTLNIDDDDDVFCDTPTTSSPPRRPPTTGPFADFESKARAARNMEKIFENMLQEKYHVHPRPHRFLKTLLHKIFGAGNTRKIKSIQVAIPTHDLALLPEPTDTPLNSPEIDKSDKPKSPRLGVDNEKRGKIPGIGITIEWERKDNSKKQGTVNTGDPPSDHAGPSSVETQTALPVVVPREMTPKAAKMLIGSLSLKKPKSTRPYQPSGLIVLPSTFIPCEPEVLEMHACKNSHLLLACKYTLGLFVGEKKDGNGLPMLSHQDFDELMWEYDCFRRRRFNWPQDHPGVVFEEDEAEDVPKPKFFSLLQAYKDSKAAKEPKDSTAVEDESTSGSKSPLRQLASTPDKSDHVVVRTIRIFGVTKSTT